MVIPKLLFGLCFQCTGCGRCCTGRGERYVEATRAGQARIRAYLGVPSRWFRRRYVTAYADGTEGLRCDGDRCAFLNGANRRRIYPVRPAPCRHYPFGRKWCAARRHGRARGGGARGSAAASPWRRRG